VTWADERALRSRRQTKSSFACPAVVPLAQRAIFGPDQFIARASAVPAAFGDATPLVAALDVGATEATWSGGG